MSAVSRVVRFIEKNEMIRTTRDTADMVMRRYLFDFKRYLSARNIFLISIIILLQYFSSGETPLGFIKQSLTSVIVSFLVDFLKKKL